MYKADEKYLFGTVALIVIYLTLIPLLYLIYQSFLTPSSLGQESAFTLSNYIGIFSNGDTFKLFKNTFIFAFASTLLASTIGIFLAWVKERTKLTLNILFYPLSIITLIMPGILFTISWIFLLSPKIGFINELLMQTLGLKSAPFNIYSMGGMIWVQGLCMSPLAFLLMSGIFRSFYQTFEEMALVSGATKFQTFRLITLKLAKPAIFSLFMIIFLKGFMEFTVPSILGIPFGIKVFTSEIYVAIRQYPPNYGLVSAYSILVLLVASLGLFLSKRMLQDQLSFATITGKNQQQGKVYMGGWRFLIIFICGKYFIVSVFLPFVILFWASLQPFYQVPSLEALGTITLKNYIKVFHYPNILNSIKLSLFLAGASASIIILISSVIAWIKVRTNTRFGILLDNLAFSPIVFPGIILGVAITFVYLNLPLPIYGTVWILLIGYVTNNLPYGIRYANAALNQVHKELEEAALIWGANWWQRFTRITLPLITPGLIAGWIYIVIISMQQLSMPLILYSPGNEVLAVTLWDLWANGGLVTLSALGTMMIIGLLILTSLIHLINRKL